MLAAAKPTAAFVTRSHPLALLARSLSPKPGVARSTEGEGRGRCIDPLGKHAGGDRRLEGGAPGEDRALPNLLIAAERSEPNTVFRSVPSNFDLRML